MLFPRVKLKIKWFHKKLRNRERVTVLENINKVFRKQTESKNGNKALRKFLPPLKRKKHKTSSKKTTVFYLTIIQNGMAFLYNTFPFFPVKNNLVLILREKTYCHFSYNLTGNPKSEKFDYSRVNLPTFL